MNVWMKRSRLALLTSLLFVSGVACVERQKAPESDTTEIVGSAEVGSERAYFQSLFETAYEGETDAGVEPVDFRAAFADLPEGVSIQTGTVSVQSDSGATQVEDFALVYDLDGTPVGIEADQVLFYNFDPDAIADRIRGSNLDVTAKVADRIELRGVKSVGMEAVSKLFVDQYIDALDTLTPIEDDLVAEFNTLDVFNYNFEMEKLLVDGFVLHPFDYAKPENTVAHSAEDDPWDEHLVDDTNEREVLQMIGAFARSFSLDALVYENVFVGYAMSDGDIDMSMDMTIGLAGLRGYDRGDLAYSGSWDSLFTGMLPIPTDPNDADEITAVPMTGGVKSSTISGVRMAQAFEALANWEMPATSQTDLFDLGRWEIADYTFDIANKSLLNSEKIVFDSDFHWLLPTKVEVSIVDTGYNIGNLFEVMTQEFGEELDPGLTMEDIRTGLAIVEQYGFDCLCGDYAMDLNWNPDTGEITYRENGKFADAFSGKTSADVGFSTPAKIAGLFDLEDPETGFEDAFKADFEFQSFETVMTDLGGLSNLFEMLHAIGEAFPDREGMAMLTYNDAAQLRMLAVNSVIGMKPMVRQQVPGADPFMDALAAFLEEGGTLTIAANPPTPITVALIESLDETNDDPSPEEIMELIGLTVTHTK